MKKGYRFGPASAQLAGMTCVAECPEFSPPVCTPHRGLKEARSSCTSTVEGEKKADCVRCTANALSGGSAAPAFLATPLPLTDFVAMAAGREGQSKGRREHNGGERE